MAERKSKVVEYEKFLNETLREDLRKILDERDKVYSQIAEYLQLKTVIEKTKDADGGELKTQVDLGCNFYVQGKVPDTARICVAVGFGFFLEFSLDEALKFIDKKTAALTDKTDQLSKDAAKVKAHIRLVLEGLREVQLISDKPDVEYRDPQA
ncbi:protein UXT-like [Haliotis rufescens]|uniref:protein UXT-like n=1 Tax=Haliotis rufescens TaxID=6454 RepID=UPI00201E89AA|nr:protein UXT-like [Haliotis rufescens]